MFRILKRVRWGGLLILPVEYIMVMGLCRNGRKSIIATLYPLARHSQVVEVADPVSKITKLDVWISLYTF
jgi:hypothetical protein